MYQPDQINIDRDQLTDITSAIVEPVDLATMKAHLRVDFDDDDELIRSYSAAARQWIERRTNHLMTGRTFVAVLPRFYETIVFPWQPFQEVTRIQYWGTDSPEELTTLFDTTSSPEIPSQVFRTDAGRARIYRASGQTWPVTVRGRHDAVQVTFSAGYSVTGSPEQVDAPSTLKSALMLMVGDLYENRESSTQMRIEQLPTAERLLSLWRGFA